MDEYEDFCTVTISIMEYDNLMADKHWVDSLEEAGLESWEMYEKASLLYDEKMKILYRKH